MHIAGGNDAWRSRCEIREVDLFVEEIKTQSAADHPEFVTVDKFVH